MSSFFALLFVAGCARAPYTMDAPEAFKRYEKRRDFHMITADGVVLQAREVKNYPRASLSFWKDAMSKHMEQQGYTLTSAACFTTNKGLKGCTLTLMLPHGPEDWTLAETIFVVDKKIIIVEVAGEFTRYKAVEAFLEKALKTFDPNF